MDEVTEVVTFGENLALIFPSEQKVYDVAEQLCPFVESMTGLSSRWNGQIVFSEETTPAGFMVYSGRKEWNCAITLHRDRLTTIGWYGTLLHEMIHSVSVGSDKANRQDLIGNRGWEEGVVEKLTRLFFVEVMNHLGVGDRFGERIQYAEFVNALEEFRKRSGKQERLFYLELLQTFLRDRRMTVLEWIREVNPDLTSLVIAAQMNELLRRLNR